MKKVKLNTVDPGQKIRMKPNTVTLIVDFHLNGQTRLILGKEGFWRNGNEDVYLEKHMP